MPLDATVRSIPLLGGFRGDTVRPSNQGWIRLIPAFTMTALSNVFSVLKLEVEDDEEEIAAHLATSKAKSSRKGTGKWDKQNGNVLNRAPTKDDNSDDEILTSSSSSSSGDYKLPLVWIDLEMTGLNIEVDRILEIACVITDGKLTKSLEGPDIVINQSKECLDSMGEWCQEHHASSGLTESVLQSTITEEDAEKQVLAFVNRHVGTQTPLLAGNSIYVDLMFLKKYMPNLASIFPHVLVDVSSVTALCLRWFPKEKKKAPAKVKKHRAMDDIKESIMELKYYKESIFKGVRRC
ncbi:hypothetical protein HPP92_004419 [Vanilla planifolia]|uniref:Exonuclease domain-containing protein n=1 Tax=Vanilla planifolia TaxID=51239 RepID=A0A835RS74_VANPL|nr:hypothetical protein HPP92_004419 [Vanilla planifolia]